MVLNHFKCESVFVDWMFLVSGSCMFRSLLKTAEQGRRRTPSLFLSFLEEETSWIGSRSEEEVRGGYSYGLKTVL